MTDVPLLVGVGVGTPALATEVAGFADGAIVGSALMKYMLDDDRDGLIRLAERFRAALPTG